MLIRMGTYVIKAHLGVRGLTKTHSKGVLIGKRMLNQIILGKKIAFYFCVHLMVLTSSLHV